MVVRRVLFRDRYDAAIQLGRRLRQYRTRNTLILGIPRGGVVIASVLAGKLNGDLDVILTRKLRTPDSPELAMGSVDENGDIYLNELIVSSLRIDRRTIEDEKRKQFEVIRRRAEAYRRIYPKIPLEGRIVIITDDGIATGATMKVAIQVARAAKPEKLVVALPVGPPDTAATIRADVDHLVCIHTPPDFMAVGQFYEIFDQVEDGDVEKILHDFADART